MTTRRRIGTETSETRAALIDAAEKVMLEEGYAAVTSRRVAAKAGLKPQLVHYYFRTMDDLFLALFRRGAEQALERQARALASDQPLWALWDLSRDPRGHRPDHGVRGPGQPPQGDSGGDRGLGGAVPAEQLAGLEGVLERDGIDAGHIPPIVLAVLMTSISTFLVIERETLGMSSGHDETVRLVEDLLTRFEGPRSAGAARSARES